MKKIILTYLGCVALWACDVPKPTQNKITQFFDIAQFTQQQINILIARQRAQPDWRVHKTIHHNSQTESHELAIKDWNKELALFQQTNLNKPTLLDAYRMDTLRDEITQDIQRIRYIANADNIYTQAVDIQYKAQQPYSISIINKSHNTIYTNEQYLEYISDKGYKIVQKQRIWGWRSDEFTVEATF